MDWQMHKNVMEAPNSKENRKELAKIAEVLTKVCKQAGLYHVDGDGGANEYLHFQFVLVDPELFYKMAKFYGLTNIEGNASLSDLLDMFGKDHDDDKI